MVVTGTLGGVCHFAPAAAGWTAGGEHLLDVSFGPRGNSHGNLGRSWRTRHLLPGRNAVLGSFECGGSRLLPADQPPELGGCRVLPSPR